MSLELTRIELAGPGDTCSGLPGQAATEYLKSGFFWVPVALVAGMGAWVLLSFHAGKSAGSAPARLASAVVAEPVPPAAATPSVVAYDPPAAGGEAIAPEEAADVDGLRISSQYWRRGGLGSNALVTFTLRNTNAYAVKDIAITCAFSRRDGGHLTDRSRVIHDTVNMRSRKTFAHLHVGFVNVNASKAKCTLVAARRV